MQVQSAPTFAPVRRAPQQSAPPSSNAPQSDDSVSVGNQPPEKGLAWGNVALLAGTTALGAGAGIYAGLNTGLIPGIISATLIPGAAIGGALVGALAGDKLRPEFMGEYPEVGGAVLGALAGIGVGVTQMFFAGDVASPLLATTMGLSGAVAGGALALKLLSKASD